MALTLLYSEIPCHRQFPANSKIKILKINYDFLVPANTKGIIFIIRKNFHLYDTIHDFTVWCRTGLNPAKNNRIQSHTE